ncbi:NADP-dependent oxidoreductase domain-containing protein [Fusarium avenaceum]|nr:NADP-dependent oxidoreductase domain-containing protein [Fusarium avenaceum]
MSAVSGFHSKKPNWADPATASANVLPTSYCPEPRSRDEKELPNVILAWKTLYEAGINFIDTAEAYGNGESERIVGELIKNFPRESVIIQTKYFSTPLKATNFIHPVDAPVKSLKASLQCMNLEYVDIYLVYGPIHPQSIQNIAKDVQKINDELAKFNIPLATNQCEYNILRRYPELTGNIEKCISSGMIFHKDNPPPKSYRFSSYKMEDLEPVLKTLQRVAKRRGKSTASIALNYNISKGVLPVVGIRNVKQAKCASEALGWRLTDSEMVEIDKVSIEGDKTVLWQQG